MTREIVEPNNEIEPLPINPSAREALNKILILNVAARDCRVETLVLRWDRKQIHNEPLQAQSIEIMRDAAMAGLDRMRGDFFTHTTDHTIYDQLFDRSAEQTHAEFVDRLAWISQNKWKLFNDPNYELSITGREWFKQNEARVVHVGDKLFRDYFFRLSEYDMPPPRFAKFFEQMIDPEVGRAYLNEDRLRRRLQTIQRRIERSDDEAQELHFCLWMLDKARQLRTTKIGHLALSTS